MSDQFMVALATVVTAISAIIGGVTSVLIERIRAGKRADKVTETLEKLVRSDESKLATLGDLSEQIARLDKRMWDHVERHHP